MCELFGLSSNKEVKVPELLKEFFDRGKQHPHGWGISWYLKNGLAGVVKEPVAAPESKVAHFFAEKVESYLMIAHIRKMSRGSYLSYSNTHPFVRSLWHRDFVFAHNGDVPKVKSNKNYELKTCVPYGDTDSEHAFCFMIEKLSAINDRDTNVLVRSIWNVAKEIGKLGKFNFLLSDGKHLFAYMNREKTLHYLLNPKVEIIRENGGIVVNPSIAVIATEKLTNEGWISMEPEVLYVFNRGSLVDMFKG